MPNLSFDTRNITDIRREKLAWKVHNLPDFKLPKLTHWNDQPCRKHRFGWTDADHPEKVIGKPKPGCRHCGVVLRRHQRIGVAWMYLKKRALLADTMGPQPLSARVLTPSGWTTVGELHAGDLVIDPTTGHPVRVAETIEQGIRPVYRVTTNDGASTLAADTHLWSVTTADDKHNSRAFKVRTTEELISAGLFLPAGGRPKGNARWYLPVTSPVEFPSSELMIDPYTLGVLIGDGSLTTSTTRVSTDHDIVGSLVLPPGVTARLARTNESIYSADYVLAGMTPYLPEELRGSKSETKRIPESYLLASSASRVALLQGLLDTDGTASGTSSVEWGTTSPQLAEDMKFLASSLGITWSMREKVPTFTYKGERKEGQKFYRFMLAFPSTIPPFRLQRKLGNWKSPTKYQPTRAIESIEYVGEEEVRCIRVDSESHLYITDDFLVTHNSGKSFTAAGVIAMMLETGELADPPYGTGRVILTPRAAALHQWYDELLRVLPSLNVVVAEGSLDKRRALYAQPWQVMLIGPEMLRNDYQMFERFKLAAVITDDIDQLRNFETDTSYALDRLGGMADRYYIMSGTPLQKRLPELHSVLDGIGGISAFGSLDSFMKSHVRSETIIETDTRTGLPKEKKKITGYRNLGEVKKKMAPMVLRRTAADLDDVEMPSIVPEDIWLDLYPAQRRKYEELRKGVITILKEEGAEVKYATALSKLHYGSAICAGLAALGEPDGSGTSVKMDWIIDNVSEGGDLGDEKVVIFANLKNGVRALQDRFRQNGIGFVTVWGEDPNKQARREAQERFWDDPNCRVLLGTRAIEQSLNLQVSRHLINMDTILNPARMEQLAGRIRRQGSAYRHVFVHNLLTTNTQESGYPGLLEREAALSSHIWSENSELFKALDPIALMNLITG